MTIIRKPHQHRRPKARGGDNKVDIFSDQREHIWFPSGDYFSWRDWTLNYTTKFYFLHVGKAGGSTLNCALQNGLDKFSCRGFRPVQPPPLYSVKFGGRCHMDACEKTNHSVALISLRNPISRLVSAFFYESGKSERWMQRAFPDFEDGASLEMR